jgi:hypothetical protein
MQETTYKGHLITYHLNGQWSAVIWRPAANRARTRQTVTATKDEGPEMLLSRVRTRIDREVAQASTQWSGLPSSVLFPPLPAPE